MKEKRGNVGKGEREKEEWGQGEKGGRRRRKEEEEEEEGGGGGGGNWFYKVQHPFMIKVLKTLRIK